MREKGQTEAAKTLETPVFSRGIEILTEKQGLTFTKVNPPAEMIEAQENYIDELFAENKDKIIYFDYN